MELGLLIEVAETQFGLGAPEDYEWHAARPGASPVIDELRRLEKSGYVTITVELDQVADRQWVYAMIAHDGRKRISELFAEGVEPSDYWTDLSFDETGLSGGEAAE